MSKERLNQVVDRAVDEALVESLKRREQELTEDIGFLRRLLAGEFDKPEEEGNEEFDIDDDDYWLEETEETDV